jgi:hypothetical protein
MHLFIAQVQAGDSVAQAHESLKPELVRQADAVRLGSVDRQGEWFFVPPSLEDLQRLDAHIMMWPRAVKKRAPVGEGQRPHVADQVVTHRNLHLKGWRRVVRNAEIPSTNDRLRIRWID